MYWDAQKMLQKQIMGEVGLIQRSSVQKEVVSSPWNEKIRDEK